MVFNHEVPNSVEVIELAAKMNNEYWGVSRNSDILHQQIILPEKHWLRPTRGTLKINSDGAYSSSHPFATIGVVCRNDSGDYIWGFCDKVKSVSAFMTEALALKRAMMLARDMGHEKVCFESDSQLLINSINSQRPNLYDWKSRSIVQDILDFLVSNVGFSVTFFSRIGNAVADCIAAEALKEMYSVGWVTQPSSLLLSLLTIDTLKSNGANQDASYYQREGVG